MTAPPNGRDAVCVTGAGIVCSVGADVASFARALRERRSGIGFATGVGQGEPPFAAEIRGFELARALSCLEALPEALRTSASRAAGRSSFGVRVATVAALEAWTSARLHEQAIDGERIGLVVCGNNVSGRQAQELQVKYQDWPRYVPPRFALQYQDTDHVGTLSQALGIRGEGFTVGGASASGNVGIIQASRLIETGEVDACVVVGALADLSRLERQSFFNLGAMAGRTFAREPQAACRPFDQAHEGFVPGQAAACLVLEAQRSAEARGVRLLARLIGYACKLDGNSQADPSEEGEARVMAEAIARAGLEPAQIGYVNAHGSSSPLGDETEVRALRRVFGRSFGVPFVNATKGWVGHCLSAAGVVEAIAVIVQLQGGFVHPNANLERPIDPECRFAGVEPQAAAFDYALSNSFGFGGFNSSVLLARPPA